MLLSRRRFAQFAVAAALGGSVSLGAPGNSRTHSTGHRPNVLFIAVDDLRPLLACYGVSFIKTPHIDRLASRSVVFERAYCQDAVCSPSRTSVLTGLRPDSTRIYDNDTDFRRYHPNLVTLPQHFRLNGYHSEAIGKIYHSCFERAYVGRRLEDPLSWSTPPWYPSPQYYHTPEGIAAAKEIFARNPQCGRDEHGRGGCMHTKLSTWVEDADRSEAALDKWADHFVMALVSEAPDLPDDELYDGKAARRAVRRLGEIGGEPFFLAVGFMKPHVPYVAPKQYWDLYDREALPLAPNPDAPVGMPPIALEIELGNYLMAHDHGVYCDVEIGGPLDEATQRRLIHGYAACVSYVDALVGRVLDALEESRQAENTIVVLWGDHGYHLGENSRWGKQTCFETATRAPLLISAPGMRAEGRRSSRLVELVDLYPTLADLSGLPLPESLEGVSMAPLLDDPAQPWKQAAYSQFPRPVRSSAPGAAGDPTDCMGYSVRTECYRLTVWSVIADPVQNAGVELYDYETDPLERRNLATDPAYASVVAELRQLLKAKHPGRIA